MKLSYQTSLEELLELKLIRVRTFNICRKFHFANFGEIIEFYNRNFTFIKFQNLGALSNNELIELCKSFKSQNGEIEIYGVAPKIKPLSEGETLFNLFYSLNKQEQEKIELFFETFQLKLSVRAQNAIANLAANNSLASLLSAFQKIDFEIGKMRNVGEKTKDEISAFLKDLYQIIDQRDIYILSRENVADRLLEQLKSLIYYSDNSIDLFLKDNFSLFDTGSFPLLELMDLLIRKSMLVKKAHRELLIKYSGIYQSEESISNSQIASQLTYSKERIRQLLVNHKIQERAINELVGVVNLFKKFDFIAPPEFMLNNEYFYNCHFEHLNVRTKFSNKFFSYFLCCLNPCFEEIRINTFEKKIILINKWILEVFRLESFLEKIDEIINTKIQEDFEINFSGFIISYLSAEVTFEQHDKIVETIERILGEFYDLYPNDNKCLLITRNVRKKLWEYMKEILNENKISMHVESIAKVMIQRGHDCDVNMVRSYLKRMDEVFMLTGPSTFGLKEWEKEQNLIGGTIKQIVVKFLENSDEPVHLYEIAKHVISQRDTNIHSIHRNLQVDPTKKFRYFGQHFFGLQCKNYSKPYNYKPVSRNWFEDVRKLYVKNDNRMLSRSHILDYIADLYKVRPIQLEYLLDQRIERGDLIETNDKLLRLA